MKYLFIVLGFALISTNALSAEGANEDWKWPADPAETHLGVLMGMGILDSSAGFTLLGTASKKILHDGFVPDISNSVSIEFQGGPLFVNGGRAFAYSTHLRWDFKRDDQWTFYSIGGFAGHVTSHSLGSRFLMFPRFGVGALRSTSLGFLLRGEFSHEFITFGLAWPI